MKATTLTRFINKVRVIPCGGCWEWIAATNNHGYGTFWDGQINVYAHRWSYKHFVGPIGDELELDHLCRNPACCNPHHLEPVTHRENMRRGVKGSVTSCPHGHPYDESNTYIRPQGTRKCRACNREREQRRTR